MRFRKLSFLLGLICAGACTSGRSNRTEPASPPSVHDDTHGDDSKSGEIEVVEEKYDSGGVRKRVEGKRNAEGKLVPHGLTSTWYESGLKWTEITFRDGVKHGPQRKWYNTGMEWSNGQYKDGIEDGLWTAYHPNGEKAREMHVDRGVWEGPFIEYHPNGRKSIEVTFVRGVRQGISTAYNDDGSIAFVTDYIDGAEQP